MPTANDWNVLIVDDEPHNIGVIEIVLRFHGAQVRSCTSGQECLDILKTMMPDFVLLDIQMPELSGYDVVKTIRSDPQAKDLTVIALTALAMPDDLSRGIAAGFDGYITKPIDVASITLQIGLLLEEKKRVPERP
jgi:CheY-like chemotaxis protein